MVHLVHRRDFPARLENHARTRSRAHKNPAGLGFHHPRNSRREAGQSDQVAEIKKPQDDGMESILPCARCSSPSVTDRTRKCSRARSEWIRTALLFQKRAPRRMCRACLWRATVRITFIAKPSRRRVPAARRRLMRNVFCQRRTSETMVIKEAAGPQIGNGSMTFKFSLLNYCVNRKNRFPTLLGTVALLLTIGPR